MNQADIIKLKRLLEEYAEVLASDLQEPNATLQTRNALLHTDALVEYIKYDLKVNQP